MNFTFENVTLENVNLENVTLESVTFENEFESGSGESGYNISNFTSTLPPPEVTSIIPLADAFVAIVGIGCIICLMLPVCIECLDGEFTCRNNNQNSRGKCCGIRFCYHRTYLSDIERNNQYNTRIITENNKKKQVKIEFIELEEIVIADSFDACETCSICLEELKEGDQLGSLPCGHKHFHKKCMESWITISGNKSCPICRATNL